MVRSGTIDLENGIMEIQLVWSEQNDQGMEFFAGKLAKFIAVRATVC